MDKRIEINYKNVLITGGAGFIGSNLALRLLDEGCSVTVVDNLSPQIHTDNPDNSYTYNLVKNKVDFVHEDITNKKIMSDLIRNKDVIIHLAAETGTGQSMYEIDKYTYANVMGTSILLNLLVNTQHCVKSLVVASSRAIYGEGKYECTECGIVYPRTRIVSDMDVGNFNPRCPNCNRQDINFKPTDENSEKHPESIYAINKQCQEDMVLTVGKMLGISTSALRYQNVYGPGQSLSNPYTGILSIFSNIIRKNEAVNIFEDGNESRDFVYIDDVVEATLMAITNVSLCDAFNVGSGVSTTVHSVATELKNYFNSASEIKVTGRYRLGDIRHNVADLNKITEIFGFLPKTNFRDGLRNFLDWVNSHEVKSSEGYQNSIEELSIRGLYK